jgi:hypothetical protein
MMNLGKVTSVVAILLALAGSSVGQDVDVKGLIGKSDAHFQKAGSGAALTKADWNEEKTRLDTVEAAIAKVEKSTLHVKIYRRLGVAGMFTSEGKGDKGADAAFEKAITILNGLHDADAKLPQFLEFTATLLKERADNAVLLGQHDKAVAYLGDALKAAKACSYKDTIAEASVRDRLAAALVRAEKWAEALETVGPAIVILTRLAEEDGSFNKEALRAPLWSAAMATSRLKKDGEPLFRRYLRELPLTAHDRADALRELAVNLGERSPKVDGPERKAALEKTLGVLTAAKAEIERSKKPDEDALERYAILADLGMNFWRLGKKESAETEFKSALAVARKSQGNDWVGLTPVLSRYRDLLKTIDGRGDDAGALDREVKRIEGLKKE